MVSVRGPVALGFQQHLRPGDRDGAGGRHPPPGVLVGGRGDARRRVGDDVHLVAMGVPLSGGDGGVSSGAHDATGREGAGLDRARPELFRHRTSVPRGLSEHEAGVEDRRSETSPARNRGRRPTALTVLLGRGDGLGRQVGPAETGAAGQGSGPVAAEAGHRAPGGRDRGQGLVPIPSYSAAAWTTRPPTTVCAGRSPSNSRSASGNGCSGCRRGCWTCPRRGRGR